MGEAEKFFVKIYLVIISSKTSTFLVSKDPEGFLFPAETLYSGVTPGTIAETLLNIYTGLSPHWTIITGPSALPISRENICENEIILLYSTFIPEETNLRLPGSAWLTYWDLEKSGASPLTLDLAQRAIWKT